MRRLGAAGVPGGGPGSAGGRWARRAGRWRGPQLPVPVSLLRALQKWRGGVVTNLIIRNRQKIWLLIPSTSLSTLRPPSAQKSGWSNEVFWVCRRAGRALIASKKVHIFFGVYRLCQHFFTDASAPLRSRRCPRDISLVRGQPRPTLAVDTTSTAAGFLNCPQGPSECR